MAPNLNDPEAFWGAALGDATSTTSIELQKQPQNQWQVHPHSRRVRACRYRVAVQTNPSAIHSTNGRQGGPSKIWVCHLHIGFTGAKVNHRAKPIQ
jgi:hypothetical protein